MTDTTKIHEAAKAIARCDFLLIATGAGFSADSGLPTYTEVAKNPFYESKGIEYGDLCRIQCLRDNPKLFYGFWGTCFNLYQMQRPHAGYSILRKWCLQKENQMMKKRQCEVSSAYYVYTSNVDGHFRLTGFPQEKLHEVHGAIDIWLPISSSSCCPSIEDKENSAKIKQQWYNVPKSYSFQIDTTVMEGSSPETIWHDLTNNDKSPNNESLLRPRVLMFDDDYSSHEQMGLGTSCKRYQEWEALMENAMEASSGSMELVVLEIGCGTRVPSVRIECQDVVQDTAARCNFVRDSSDGFDDNGKHSCCTFIRINPENEEIHHVSDNVQSISMRGTALDTLLRIDEIYQKLTSFDDSSSFT